MTKEERAASRVICNATTEGPWEAYLYTSEVCGIHDARFIAHARTALPAALDALDEMEKRAQALERAINDLDELDSGEAGACATCSHTKLKRYETPCNDCAETTYGKHTRWEFDQERFKG